MSNDSTSFLIVTPELLKRQLKAEDELKQTTTEIKSTYYVQPACLLCHFVYFKILPNRGRAYVGQREKQVGGKSASTPLTGSVCLNKSQRNNI